MLREPEFRLPGTRRRCPDIAHRAHKRPSTLSSSPAPTVPPTVPQSARIELFAERGLRKKLKCIYVI